MGLEIRPAREPEMEELNHVVRTAFGFTDDFKLKLKPEWTVCAFSDGKLSTSYAAWPLAMQFVDRVIPFAGVTMVGTLPAYRRRNQLRKVVETHFRLLHENGERPVAGLLASMAAIYQRYGFGVVSTRNTYSIEPQNLRLIPGKPVEGQFFEVEDRDIDLLLEIYQHFVKGRVGYLERGEDLKTIPEAAFGVLTSHPPSLPPVKLIYREAGRPLGYLIYSTSREITPQSPMGQRISVHDMAWLSASAYRAVWEYFSNMDLISRVDWTRAPVDDPLPHLMLEPRKLNSGSADGMLGRIVDVEKALPLRPYYKDCDLVFEVIDDICSWNRGCWKLSVSGNSSEIKPSSQTPGITLPVSTLAMLFFGQISPERAAEMGRLDVNREGVLKDWNDTVRTPFRPFCSDGF